MERQLSLLGEREVEWRLDEDTKTIGRQGVAAAREALRRARAEARAEDDRHGHSHAA